jgi:murein DD-endopeptidase MepM/ murein hydrolase activator NlpD
MYQPFIKPIFVLISVVIFMTFSSTSTYGIEVIDNFDEQETNEWIWPLDGNITDHFGTRGGQHFGIDISARKGMPVVAANDGKVVKSYYSITYGHVVFIQHKNEIETVYAHLSKRVVKEDDVVSRGETIGFVGNTGFSKGDHLHFEVHKGEWNMLKTNSMDPIAFFDSIGDYDLQRDFVMISEPVYDLATMSLVNNRNPYKAIRIVKKGDTLWDIANEFGVSVSIIKEWNDLESHIIEVNDEIVLFPKEDEVYVVQTGDTLRKIAESFNISVQNLKQNNRIIKNKVHVDQLIVIKR